MTPGVWQRLCDRLFSCIGGQCSNWPDTSNKHPTTKRHQALHRTAPRCTALGTAPARANKTMSAASKLVSTHQNVLIVTKGQKLDKALAVKGGNRACEEARTQGD